MVIMGSYYSREPPELAPIYPVPKTQRRVTHMDIGPAVPSTYKLAFPS